jgi:Tfp pilus assembly protein PilW
MTFRNSEPEGEAGFTIVEILITVVISMGVLASLLSMLTSQSTAERRVQDVANSQESIRLAYVELTRDLRAADPLVAATDTSVELLHHDSAGVARRLRWAIETSSPGAALVRREVAADGTTAVSYRLVGLASATSLFRFDKAGPVFAPIAAAEAPQCAKRVGVDLRATAAGDGAPLQLSSDVDLRNVRVSALC